LKIPNGHYFGSSVGFYLRQTSRTEKKLTGRLTYGIFKPFFQDFYQKPEIYVLIGVQWVKRELI
jgi:hypothetical protein